MPITIHQTEQVDGTNADPSVVTLGNTYTAGRSIVLAIMTGFRTVVGVTDSGSNTWVEDLATSAIGTDDFAFYRCQSIGTPPTSITVDLDANSPAVCAVFEVSGLAASPLNDTNVAAQDGSGTSHDEAFTTSETGELAIGCADHNQSSSGEAGASGTTIIVPSDNRRLFMYKISSVAGADTLDFTTTDSENPYMASVTYSPAAAGATFDGPHVDKTTDTKALIRATATAP